MQFSNDAEISQNDFKKKLKIRIYKWTLELIKDIDTLQKDNSSQIIGKQLLRSGTSVGANFIEAQAASSKKDFINFLLHSLKSANESKFWIIILRDLNKLQRDKSNNLLNELVEIANILGASIATLKGKKKNENE